MTKTWQLLPVVFIGIGSIHLKLTTAYYSHLDIAWIVKPPYTTLPNNNSFDVEVRGMMREALLKFFDRCFKSPLHINLRQASSESEMIGLLKQNKVEIVSPIFEHPSNRRYRDFHFLKFHDYPGSEFITTDDDTKALKIVRNEVLKSWPLLAITLIFTAIAGVIIWVLDTKCNIEEFRRSFIKGSWDGFWWSFISMTTVGYGDKTPKSISARIFSVIWILFGLIGMAIFTGNVTSALTALSLENGPGSLSGLKVAVLRNGAEYPHAVEEDADPKVYETIEDIIEALHSNQVEGMLLDRYTASYYQARDKLKSLITVKKFEFRGEIGALISKKIGGKLPCFEYYRSSIWRSVETFADAYKLIQQKPVQNESLFGYSTPFVKYLLYISLAVLVGLLLIGTMWDIFIRRKPKDRDDVEIGRLNGGVSTERDAIRSDLEVTSKLLREVQEHFENLEYRVLTFQNYP